MLSAIFFWAGSGKGKIMTHYALIGHPLGHSLSPQIHRALLAAAHLEGDYRLLDTLHGFNVTIPLKQAVLSAMAELDE